MNSRIPSAVSLHERKRPVIRPMKRATLKALLMFVLLSWGVAAQEPSASGAAPAAPTGKVGALKPPPPPQFELPNPPGPSGIQVESSVNALTNIPLKMVGPDLFELGRVRMDKRQRTVSFPGSVNMAAGPQEYLLVAKWGKTHESVLQTDVEPFQIHLAMLLINATGAPPVDVSRVPGGGGQFISNPSKDAIPGDRVTIGVSWQNGDKELNHRGEDLVFNLSNKAPMNNAAWIYNGSRIWGGRYMAQMGGSIVSLVSDPDAQINSMALGHDNDRIWNANTNVVPAVGTPVQITIKLEDSTGK